MWFSVSEHLLVTVYAFFMGVFLGVLYDFIRLTRILLGIGSYSSVARKFKVKTSFVTCADDRHTRSGKRGYISSCILCFLGDILFGAVSAACYSVFLFHAIRGQVRWFFILASAVGFFLYYFTVSRFFLGIAETVVYAVKAVVFWILHMILTPFRLIFGWLIKVIGKAVVRVSIYAKHALAMRKTAYEMSKIPDYIKF